MSRCFPFPPLGYEKKAIIEDTDLLTKEKHKEKKHKKDKKDKEKKEGKEKKNKDKERSKEKGSDKKDRKEKYKDKKEKDKNWTLDAKIFEWQLECNNGDKLGPNSIQSNKISDSKYVQDLARRIRDDDKATGSQIGQKIIVTDQRKGELPRRTVEHSINNLLEEKEKSKDKKENDKKVNGQRNYVEVSGFRNAIVPGFSSMDQKRFQGTAKPVNKNDIRKQGKEKEKNKLKDSYNKASKHKDGDREKKSKSKDENRDKEKEMEEKTKKVSGTSKDQLKLRDSSPKLEGTSKGILNSCNTKPLDVLKTVSNNPACEGILGKRKELEINGIVDDNGNQPKKLPKPVSYSQQVMENGRKLELCHTAVHITSEWQGAVNNHKLGMKEHKINDLMEVPKPIVYSSGSLSTKARATENGEASVKPQHPDSKYLDHILSVPELVDFSDVDDQEWLFSSETLQSKKPKVGPPEVDGTEQQVWAEALEIESADLTALPYVIPY